MNWFDGKKLLVPIDFGEESKKALDASLEMTPGSDIYVLHVAPDLASASPEVIWDSHTDELRRENIEASFHKTFSADQYEKLRFHVTFGDPGHGIAEFAEEIGADVIVMPSHGRTGLKRLLLGSVAERVLRLWRTALSWYCVNRNLTVRNQVVPGSLGASACVGL